MTVTGTLGTRSTVAERWRRLPRRWQAVLATVAVLVVATIAVNFAGGLFSAPSPPVIGPASSFDTSGPGTAAFAQLLRDHRYPLEQLNVPIKDASLPAGATVFVLDPDPGVKSEVGAMRRILAAGGRLVLAGRSATTAGVVRALTATAGAAGTAVKGSEKSPSPAAPPAWRPAPAGDARPVTPAPEVRGVSSVQTGPTGSFAAPSSRSVFHVLLQGPGGPFALVAKSGRGTLVLLASSAPLQNSGLGHADDAAFGLDLAGRTTTPVAFDEYDHGAGRTSPGLAGLPGHWKAALALALAAFLVWLLAASRRFGPPEQAQRELIPPRVAHVDAMATLLAAGPAGRLAEGAAPLRSAARERLSARVRAGPAASDAELIKRAADEGFPPEMVSALLRSPATTEDLVALGRAAVAIDGGEGRGGGVGGRSRRWPLGPEGQER